MLPHPLANFDVHKCYQNEPGFNGVYSRNGSPIINLDEYKSIGIHWIALYVSGDNITYFISFEVEYVPKTIKNLI